MLNQGDLHQTCAAENSALEMLPALVWDIFTRVISLTGPFTATRKNQIPLRVYSDFSKLGCLWELTIGETRCTVFDLKRYGK